MSNLSCISTCMKILPVENKNLQVYYKKNLLLVHLFSHRKGIFETEDLLFGLSRKDAIIALIVPIVGQVGA